MAIDFSQYTRRARDVNADFANNSAMNALGRFVAQQRGSRNLADYATSYRRSNEDYARNLARQKADYGTQYGRRTQDYTTSYKRGAPRLTAGFGARGLAGGGQQSGVYTSAMNNYRTDYQNQMSRAQEDYSRGLQYAQEDFSRGTGRAGEDYRRMVERANQDTGYDLNMYDLNQAQLTSARDRALTDIETDKAKEIALAAQYLSALRPMFS